MTDGTSWDELQLFDPGPETVIEVQTKAINSPVWSESKADLIARYLRYFVFVTRHGTYLDAFAVRRLNVRPSRGPQNKCY